MRRIVLIVLLFSLHTSIFLSGFVRVANANPKNYAVVIGVENYDHMGKHEYSLNDAKDMATHLSNNGWEVTKLEDATMEQVVDALLNLALNAKPEDKVFIYFSGHTLHAPDGEEEQDGEDEFLALKDTNASKVDETGIKDDELRGYIGLINSEHTAVVIEACRAEGYFETAKASGCIETGACNETEEEYYSSYLKHGVYTYFLLDALKRGLSLEKAHEEASGKTLEFLQQHVPPREQHPTQQDNYEGEYIVNLGGVGGIAVTVDKFGLLVPYICLASTIIIATVAAGAYIKQVKHKGKKIS